MKNRFDILPRGINELYKTLEKLTLPSAFRQAQFNVTHLNLLDTMKPLSFYEQYQKSVINARKDLFSHSVAKKALELNSGISEKILNSQKGIVSEHLKRLERIDSNILSGLRLFEGLNNLPDSAHLAFDVVNRFKIDSTINFEDIDDNDLKEEIRNEIDGENDFLKLSPKSQKLLFLFISLIWPIVIDVITSYTTPIMRDEIDILIQPSNGQIRKSVVGFDVMVLSKHRVISGDRVNIREFPSMKSTILNTLNRGHLVRVTDSSNRRWLEVEFELDGETYLGWVSRKYALVLHK